VPPLLDDLCSHSSLSKALFIEDLNACGAVNSYPLLQARVEGRAHRLQVTSVKLVAQFLDLLLDNATKVNVRAEIHLVGGRYRGPASPAARARGAVPEAERG